MGNQYRDPGRRDPDSTDTVLKILTAVGSLLTLGGSILGVSLGLVAIYFVVLGLAVLFLTWSIARLWLPRLRGNSSKNEVQPPSAQDPVQPAADGTPSPVASPGQRVEDASVQVFDDEDFGQFKKLDLDVGTEDAETETSDAFVFTEDDFGEEDGPADLSELEIPAEPGDVVEDPPPGDQASDRDEKSGPIVFDASDFSDE